MVESRGGLGRASRHGLVATFCQVIAITVGEQVVAARIRAVSG
jgi:hypothetical protein